MSKTAYRVSFWMWVAVVCLWALVTIASALSGGDWFDDLIKLLLSILILMLYWSLWHANGKVIYIQPIYIARDDNDPGIELSEVIVSEGDDDER